MLLKLGRVTKSTTTTIGVAELSEETIKKVLMDSGLTEKEAEVYIFLAKHDAMKVTEIARLLGKDKAQVFRILNRLQTKGFAESTVEFPTHFTVVPFENILDSIIGTRQKEVALIEKSRKELLDYLKKKHKAELEPSLEKFVVFKGNKRIYSRISKMILDTKHQLLTATTVPGMMRADQFGIFDVAFNHPLRSQITYRFLTELSEKNLNIMKTILKRTPKTDFNLKARNPDLGLSLFPRMVTRDNEEILFFITPRTDKTEKDDVCLWTNCKSLVQAFTAVFEDLWTNSTDINEKISEIETGKPTPATRVISDAHTALETYNEALRSAQEEIMIMTSSKGLIESWKHISLLKEQIERGISVKIMSPIIKDNLQAAQELLKCCAVKHVSASYSDTVIVDGKRLFQSQASSNQKSALTPHFYTDDFEYVGKTKKMLNEVWKNASVPSVITLDSILKPPIPASAPLPEEEHAWSKPDGAYQKMIHAVVEKPGITTEKDVLNKIVNAEKYPAKDWPKDIIRVYGSSGHAVIHPPDSFNLPDMMIWVNHFNKQSQQGGGDRLIVYLWLETPKGYAYVPVAIVTDNPRAVESEKVQNAGTPAGENVHLVKKNELQVRVQGNIVFAGWTKPIPLLPSLSLPPACILLEGYSKLNSGVVEYVLPSGVKTNIEYNGFDAFVTFFHPASKYSGPGTEGTIGRDIVITMYPPRATET
jgi:sugar-specific transcriptional regulator TrmB